MALLFSGGSLSFADEVVEYLPSAGGFPPTALFQNQDTVLGAPDSTSAIEPIDGLSTLSLGLGGTLTVEFTDNLLTGSDDAQPDLVVFEVGAVESVRVEISRDGTSFFDVGVLGGLTNQLDIDSFGFSSQDRFAFVRVTDLRQGDPSIPQLGADIDAIGALSSAPIEDFTAGGIGINIIGNAAPTLLNNLISNSVEGISVDSSNTSLVLGANSYYRNETDVPDDVSLGQFSQVLSPAEVVFVGAERFVFTPAAGASIIDSSIDSLAERSSLTTVRNPLGIPTSPILAPTFDVSGQLRVDDPNVETPSGLGERVFGDRGASDRGDLDGPRAILLTPRAPGIGTGAGAVSIFGEAPRFFEVQLIDGLSPADVTPGTGLDDVTISGASVLVLQDNEPLVEGIDYRFGYNPSTNIIRITPTAGVFELDSTYVIRMIDSTDAVINSLDGNLIDDGAVLNVLDVLGNSQSFEFETGITIDISDSLTGETSDGIVFDVFDGSTLLTFELDSDGLFGVGNVISLPTTATAETIADTIATTINSNPALDFTATALGSSIQLLGGTPLSTVSTTSLFIAISGEIGTSVGFGIQIPVVGAAPDPSLIDGQSFTILRGAVDSETFEFDFNGTLNDPLADPQATPVSLPANPTLDDISGAIIRAIASTGLGLDAIDAGFGRIVLDGDATFALDLTDSTLLQFGVPGQQTATPISVSIDDTAAEIAEIVAATIDSQNLPGVSTSVVDSRVFLEGTGGISGFGAADLVTIADQVGNQLQSNQPNGRTELTIFVGGGFDFGDAPSPYVSLEVEGGPRNAVDPDFSFGSTVTPDSNALVPNADLDDGITIPSSLQAGFSSNVAININNPDGREFFVDAWFDWNADGVFAESERIGFASVGSAGGGRGALSAGTNNVLVNVPANTPTGEIYARFRLTDSPFPNPLGLAALADGTVLSGEIEDYPVIVTNNPFQNAANNADVNASGFASPVDALQIINVLDRANLPDNSIDLSNPAEIPSDMPEFPDVNGDGFVTALDALRVINFLSDNFGNGEQNAEGESVANTFVASSGGVLTSTATLAGNVLIEQAIDDDVALQAASTIDNEPVSKTSVFDDAAVVNLDSIVDTIAQDTAEAGSDEEADAVDQLFAQF